jgi:hypothetical protein
VPSLNTSPPPSVPETGAEVQWLALSFLALPVQEQRSLIERADLLGTNASVADADLLQYVVESHTVEWQEDFEPCESFKALLELIARIPCPSTYSQFLTSPLWAAARVLAAASLREAGLPPWRFTAPLSLAQYVEVHSQTPRAAWPQ